MSDLAQRQETQLSIPGVVTETGLELPPDLTYDEWESVGRTLQRIERSVMWWVGDWYRFGEHHYGENAAQAVGDETGYAAATVQNAAWVADRVPIFRRLKNLSWSHHQEVATLPAGEQEAWLTKATDNGWSQKEFRDELRKPKYLEPGDLSRIKPGTYSTVVIDPPWPMVKIARDVRPNQKAMDYPSMELDAIRDLPIGELAGSEGCHLYLWTTHKFLPEAMSFVESWGFEYQCLMTWVKNVGITPFSWMYDTEHVIFARRGSLDLTQLGLRLSFTAPVTKHSEKPDAFYERVAQASPGPRLEMFARRPREGFEPWGNEVADVV